MKDNLQNLFAKKAYHFTKEQVAKLGKDDLKSVQTIFKTTKDSIEFQKATNILAAVDPKGIKKSLISIGLDPKQGEAKQIAALNSLNEFANPADETYYLKGIQDVRLAEGVQYRLIQGLGRIGSVKSLASIEKMRHVSGLTTIATLSSLLIKARNGLKNDVVFDVSPTPVNRKVSREKRAPMKLRKRTFEIKDDFGMKLEKSGHGIKCGRALLTFVLNAEFDYKDNTRAQLAGLITAQFEESSDVFSKYIIVFDQSRRGQNQVLVFRNDGVLSYGGIVQPDGSFVVECTRKMGSDLAKVHGKIENGKIQFTSHETANQRIYGQAADRTTA